jgi:predicted GH43/DUF377 family glycosyl hydrolase
MIKLEKFDGNPIIQPIEKHSWEALATFNPAAIYEDGRVHILYRAMGADCTSVLGYASSSDGLHIDERVSNPVYSPREEFEKKSSPGNSGCEDPRITKIGSRFYMCYTAYDAKSPTKVAFTSIRVVDFLHKKWDWKRPIIISPLGGDDRNACVLPEKFGRKYVFFHRIQNSIWIDSVGDLEFNGKKNIKGIELIKPRKGKWDSSKIGIAAPPIKTKGGWLLIYHGLSEQDMKYRLGAILLDLKNPDHIIAKLDYPILEPDEWYEDDGLRAGTVFACGAVVIDKRLFVYYGGADKYVCVATVELDEVLEELKKNPYSTQPTV